MSVNKVILVGRLGRDPELKHVGSGTAVANFGLATDETRKDSGGERQKITTWHQIVVWGKQAEIAEKYLKKGSMVYIEGKIQIRDWQSKDGEKKKAFEIVCENFRMLGGGSGENNGENKPKPLKEQFREAGHAAGKPVSDEDIPF